MTSYISKSAWFTELPHDCPIDDEIAAWFISPFQQTLEFLISTCGFTYLLITCWKKEQIHVSLKHRAEKLYPRLQHDIRNKYQCSMISDIFIAMALIASLSLIFYHKWHKSRVWFMTQPCYALHTLLLIIMLFPHGSTYGSLLFNIYLHLMFSPFLGLVGANTSVYKQWLEYENWFVEHALLLVTPFIFIYTHRFVLVRGINFLLMSFSLEVLYHSLILLPGSFISGLNLNYIMCPPAGLLSSMSIHYRWVMTLILCPILMIIIRYGVIELFIRIVNANAYIDDVEEHPEVVLEPKHTPRGTPTSTTKTIATTSTTTSENKKPTSPKKKRIEIEYESDDNAPPRTTGIVTRSASKRIASKRVDE